MSISNLRFEMVQLSALPFCVLCACRGEWLLSAFITAGTEHTRGGSLEIAELT
jgi:hypothetical protein